MSSVQTIPPTINNHSPVREYRTIVQDSGSESYTNRLLVATPTTGLVRVEWVAARYGQIIPTNWGLVNMMQYLDSYMPLRYQVDDAQNLIVKQVVEKDFEWLILIEHDVIMPPDAFIRLNDYIRKADTPVVSGLYYTRSYPSEPILYRGRGTSFYTDWKMGDLAWVDGVPTGILLVHGGLLRSMWQDAEEYMVGNVPTRKVFETPRKIWFDPESESFNTTVGTSDLHWCTRVMEGDYFTKAGWTDYSDKEYPFLVDTNIFCKHIDPNGAQYP